MLSLEESLEVAKPNYDFLTYPNSQNFAHLFVEMLMDFRSGKTSSVGF